MDHRNRLGYHRCDRRHVALLNLAIIGVCVAMYGVALLANRNDRLSPALRFHLFDFLAAPSLLAFANLLTIRSPFVNAFVRPPMAFLLMGVAAAEWELLAPLYTESTFDLWDVLAYFIGAIIYVIIARAPPNTAMQPSIGAHRFRLNWQ